MIKSINFFQKIYTISLVGIFSTGCYSQKAVILPGAFQTEKYIQTLKGKQVALVANQSSTINNKHLVDTLLALGIEIKVLFGPEHGYLGNAADGELIDNSKDIGSGISIVSLYGQKRKPEPEDLKNIDIVVFDIQDVGVRFFTYLSTLHYIMEACAESNIPLMVLDRPNPNGFYIDGPVMQEANTSYIGLHPVPIVCGMTIGEYARMINGESWLNNSLQCDLSVIKCKHYSHDSKYQLPVNPSPNLQHMQSIYLYPSLALFEGTVVSIGRGTNFPFQVFGHPQFSDTLFSFKPESKPGISINPKHKGKTCYGFDLREFDPQIIFSDKGLILEWILEAYALYGKKDNFFTSYFNLLAGNNMLKEQIKKGLSPQEIRQSWEKDIQSFLIIRETYLLYP